MENSSEISFEIRKSFLNFFKKNSHKEISSSSLIPKDDPSLLFTNAGMVQFKNWFTGDEKPKYQDVVTIQKCLRVGGKHNDLDNVGFTPRHHTFFEMLGNFSFGGYFKEQAIDLAWKLLIKEFSMDKNRLIITVYNDDEFSYNIWKKISGFSDSQILKISTEDNFWSMGESGPCGPCSEIFFDNGDGLSGGLPGSNNQDGERYVEIWNLVFMEYEKINGQLKKLPTQCVDTGMGLERITSLLSNKTNNFETDLFEYIFSEIERLAGIKKNNDNITSFRIISDHIRAINFLLSEGMLPSNEGRGYVLRRIIRRALLHSYKIAPRSLILHKLVGSVIKKYSKVYYELEKTNLFIEKNLKNEEEKFFDTLDAGIKLLNKEIRKVKGNDFSADLAFKLYDTYGFPVDMTESILSEKKMRLDMTEYNKIVEKSRLLHKKTWVGSGEVKIDKVFLEMKGQLNSTKFLGYDFAKTTSTLKKIIYNGQFKNSAKTGLKDLILVFDSTPFYAESGGQVGDSGKLLNLKNKEICKITDTKKIDGDIFLHFVKKIEISLKVGSKYILAIDESRRDKIRNNHSATHLLHESLRQVVGRHVSQSGSLVNDGKLRFDYTSNKQLTEKQIFSIENLVNNSIRSNLKTAINLMPVKDAIESGAIALFGEKYPEKVRVVSMSNETPSDIISSKELCGGTHVRSTGEIGSFKILGDFSISSGVRRVEAITGEEVQIFFNKKLKLLNEIKDFMKASDENLKDKIVNLREDYSKLKKSTNQQKSIFSNEKIIQMKDLDIYYDNLKCLPKELKNNSDAIKDKFKSGIIVLVSNDKKKVSVVVSLTKDLIKNYDSIEILKRVTSFLGGTGGGGRRDMAQGGAPYSDKVSDLKNFLTKLFDV